MLTVLVEVGSLVPVLVVVGTCKTASFSCGSQGCAAGQVVAAVAVGEVLVAAAVAVAMALLLLSPHLFFCICRSCTGAEAGAAVAGSRCCFVR